MNVIAAINKLDIGLRQQALIAYNILQSKGHRPRLIVKPSNKPDELTSEFEFRLVDISGRPVEQGNVSEIVEPVLANVAKSRPKWEGKFKVKGSKMSFNTIATEDTSAKAKKTQPKASDEAKGEGK